MGFQSHELVDLDCPLVVSYGQNGPYLCMDDENDELLYHKIIIVHSYIKLPEGN